MLFISTRLLAQQAPTLAAEASALMVNFFTLAIAAMALIFGVQLLRTGTRPEKSGVEFAGFKINLESTTGGILIVTTIVIVVKLLGHFYGG